MCTAVAAYAAEIEGPLRVFTADSLAAAGARVLAAFRAHHPAVQPAQESAGSLDLVRRITDLGEVPDVLLVADFEVLPHLLMPRHASWYAVVARNRMVIAYRPESAGAAALGGTSWYEVLLRPDVVQGVADPDRDPAGYRTRMVWELAERHYGIPGLAARLRAAVRAQDVRPQAAQLVALLEVGEIDYAWVYRSVAEAAGLRYVTLPPEIDLGDPARAAQYAAVAVEVAGATPAQRRTIRGLPIVYALTIPAGAPHRAAAEAFVAFLAGPEGHAALAAAHLEPVAPPQANDPAALPGALRPAFAPLAFAPPAR
ncbi:MAG TPA: extracellular solute-binding protein [Candidatus Binatia bacterium]|nr:extracellular solute-binding protein [Candidatus Binatia bacterium]